MLNDRQAEMKARMDENKEKRIKPAKTKPTSRFKSSPPVEGPGWVYVVRLPDGPYKIGITQHTDPIQRVKYLNRGLPLDLQSIGFFWCDNPSDIEAILHARFERLRIRREWFELDGGDIATIFKLYPFKDEAALKTHLEAQLWEAMRRKEVYDRRLRGEA
jgi:hypothetical protein